MDSVMSSVPSLISWNTFRRRPLAYCSGSLGYFQDLPLELLYLVFSYLPLDSIGNLGLTTEKFRILVSDWIGSAQCHHRSFKGTSLQLLEESTKSSLFSSSAFSTLSRDFCLKLIREPSLHDFSILIKRVTTLLNTKERIRFAFTHFHQHLGRNLMTYSTSSSSAPLDRHWRLTEYFVHLANCLHQFIRGWDESEYFNIFKALDNMLNLQKRIDEYMNLEHPNYSLESREDLVYLRLILRTLWWDFAETDSNYRSGWLLANLEHFVGNRNAKGQAKILFLMFGPEQGLSNEIIGHYSPVQNKIMSEYYNSVDWEYMSNEIPDDFHSGKNTFFRLSQCICNLAISSKEWCSQMLVPVLDNLFSTPYGWLKENIAAMLLFCNEKVILIYVQRKLDLVEENKGYSMRVPATLLIEMMNAAHRFDNELTPNKGVGNIVEKICKYPKNKDEFFEAIWNTLEDIVNNDLEGSNLIMEDVISKFGFFLTLTSELCSDKDNMDVEYPSDKRTITVEE